MPYPDFDLARFQSMLQGEPMDQAEVVQLMHQASAIAFGWKMHSEILMAMQLGDLDSVETLADYRHLVFTALISAVRTQRLAVPLQLQ
jgi:hypothetical protein